MKEETGLDVQAKEIIGTYTDPDVRIEYSDGEVRREFTIVFLGTTTNGDVIIDDESSAYAWIKLSEIENYPMADAQRKRIKDVLDYYRTGNKKMG